jgi:thiamine biosynthesis lipoprotein
MMMSLTRRKFTLICSAGLLGAFSTTASSAAITMAGAAFGTYWRVSLPVSVSGNARRQIVDVIETVDRSMSPYRRDSELSRFNRMDDGSGFIASRHLRYVTSAALDLSKRTGGAFDPTVGGLVGRYGFGPIEDSGVIGYRGLSVSGDRIHKQEPALTLDLCGIAKGYAIDLIVQQLRQLGIVDFLVDLGGELRAGGAHPTGRKWTVAIEPDHENGATPTRLITLTDAAVATSGTTENSYRYRGKRYSHLINPERRRPIENHIVGVTVLAKYAIEADGWATALAVLGPRDALKVATQNGIDCHVRYRDNGVDRELTTNNFRNKLI